MGAGCEIAPGATYVGPPHEHDPADPPPPGETGPGQWFGYYAPFRVTVSAPSTSPPATNEEYKDVYVWLADVWGPGVGNLPPDAIVVYGDLAVPVQFALAGVYAKQEALDDPPDDRELMDFTDRRHEIAWYADEEATVTVTATLPDGSTISVTGPLAVAGGEFELGQQFYLRYAFEIGRFDYSGVVYGRMSGIKWGDEAVDLSHLDLYNPGADPPDGDEPDWGRTRTQANCFRVGNDGGIAIWSEDYRIGLVVDQTWTGWTAAPWMQRFKPLTGKFADDVDYDDILVYGAPIEWYQDDQGDWQWRHRKWSGELEVVESRSSWEWQWEWKQFDAHYAWLVVDQDWRVANEEDVGDNGDPDENDRTCGLCLYPLTAEAFEGEPWWQHHLDLQHATSIDVNDPPGVDNRPSLWQGSGGVTVDPSDNDRWTVAAGSTTPKVERTLATRYWLRLDRLSSGWTPGEEYNPDWPIMLKANLPIDVTQDDPDWWDSSGGGVDAEDIWNWAEFAYLRLRLNAPRAGQVRLVIDASLVRITDPCYTCAEYRWQEFGYTRQPFQLSYIIDVQAGDHTYLIDLALNEQKVVPSGDYRLQHVDKITFELPAAGSSDETWQLLALELVLDPGEGSRPEPETHCWARYVRNWAWPWADWFGFGAVVDGKDALEVDYGYDYPNGHTRQEKKLLYIQRREHCPTYSGPATRLDYAKPLSRLVDELGWQEGWQAVYREPEKADENEDDDENRVIGVLRWWDIRHCHEWRLPDPDDGALVWGESNWGEASWADFAKIDGAIVVGRGQMLAGTWQEWWYIKYPRGRIHGIARDKAGLRRLRNWGPVRLYAKHEDATDYALAGSVTTDEHGRYRLPPVRERHYVYGVDNRWELLAVNREYTAAHGLFNADSDPDLCRDAAGRVWEAVCLAGQPRVRYWPHCLGPPTDWRDVADGGNYTDPSICPLPDGRLLLAIHDEAAGHTVLFRSVDDGHHWEAIEGMLAADLERAAIRADQAGILFAVGYAEGAIWIERSGDEGATVDTWRDGSTRKKVCDLQLDEGDTPPQPAVEILPDGSILVAVNSGGGTVEYRSRDRGETWEGVA